MVNLQEFKCIYMAGEEKFMREALQLAEENLTARKGGPFGAVVVKNGEIISRGVNTVIADHDPTAHAEINAIRAATRVLNSYQLEDCDIYTSCEPCPMCMGAIYWARPSRVFFAADRKDAHYAGFDDSFIYDEVHVDGLNRKIPFGQMMKNKALEIFRKWIELETNINY